jgi:hypothetical protein
VAGLRCGLEQFGGALDVLCDTGARRTCHPQRKRPGDIAQFMGARVPFGGCGGVGRHAKALSVEAANQRVRGGIASLGIALGKAQRG